MPYVETSRKVIEHFNRSEAAMKSFDEVGYFVYQNVKVYQNGKREISEKRDSLNIEDVNFGKKA